MSWLEYVYPLDIPPRPRTRPMQVLAVGLSRSGTDSLRNALIHLGFDKTYHGWQIAERPSDNILWHRMYLKKYSGPPNGCTQITTADFDAIMGDCVACTDTPASMFARDMIAAYPEAKVILNYRKDTDAWYTSTVATFCGNMVPFKLRFLSFFDAELFWFFQFLTVTFPRFYHGSFKRNGKWVAREHLAMIRGLVPSENLLEWTVEEGWEPLCKFLDKEVPDIPFPRVNAPGDLGDQLTFLHRQRVARAIRNAVVASSICIGALSGFWYLR